LYPEPFWGQKNASNPAKTLFLENACLRDEKTLLIWRRPFYFRERLFLGQKDTPNQAKSFFLENACFWDKKTLQFQRRTLFSVSDFGALGLAPPCPKIVPAPLL